MPGIIYRHRLRWSVRAHDLSVVALSLFVSMCICARSVRHGGLLRLDAGLTVPPPLLPTAPVNRGNARFDHSLQPRSPHNCEKPHELPTREAHFDLRYHFIRHALEKGQVQIEYIPTSHQSADILTKALGSPKHQRSVELIGLV